MSGEVLIAEDDENMQELIRRSLPEGLKPGAVRFFRDGRELLDYLFRLGPHRDTRRPIPKLIVLDLDMPLVHGRSIIRILKNEERLRAIPAVVLTGDPNLHDKLLGLGADAYYIKPMDLSDLKVLFSDIMKKWMN